MATLKQRLHRKTSSGYDIIHLETSASLVLMSDGRTVENAIIDVMNSNSGSKAIPITLTTGGWTLGSDDRYSQTVSVAGVTTDISQVIVIDVSLSDTDVDANNSILEAWQYPSAHNIKQNNGSLTFYSYEVPAINIPLNVGVG